MLIQVHLPWKSALVATLLLGVAGMHPQSDAKGIQQTLEYAACMRLARILPEEGFESALAWADIGGEGAAQHCAAVALFSMGQIREAAVRFEELAQTIQVNVALRSDLLAQAGQAWHQAGEIDRAYRTYSVALKLTPRAPQIRIDRAMVLAEFGRYGEAIDDLDVALDVDAGMVDALVLRASAYRYLDALELAFKDISRALELSPRHPEALLERGIVARLQGRPDDARYDWLALLRFHEGTPAANAARRNLEILDVKSQ